MKKKIIGMTMMLLMIASVFTTSGETQSNLEELGIETQENLAPNPSFEEGTGDIPQGWEIGQFGLMGTYTWYTTGAHLGERCISISGAKSTGRAYELITEELIPFNPSISNFEFSVWFKTSGEPMEEQNVFLGMELHDENEDYLLYSIGFYPEKTYPTDWTYVGSLTDSMITWVPEEIIQRTRYVKLSLCQIAFSGTINPSFEVFFDDVFFGTSDNVPPGKPETPSGATSGKPGTFYTYSTNTMDTNSDDIYFLWDWGDGTESGWLGPYNNGDICEQEHVWSRKGNFNVRVKAKDTWDTESEWSDSLVVTMPKTHNPNFIRLIHNHPLLIKPLEKLFSHEKINIGTTDDTEYWGLLIAVGEYLNHPDQDRPSMLVEVENMYQSLLASENWNPSHIRKITGQNANLDNILDGFLWLLQMAKKDDVSLVYITTHGGYLDQDLPPKDEADGKDEILVPYEGFDDPTKFLWDDEINFILSILRSKGICMIVDSCYSGGFNDALQINIQTKHAKDEPTSNKNWIKETIQELGSSTGRVILMSSEEDEVSYGSRFSRYIANGLQGDADTNHDDLCTAEEAFEFAEDNYGAGADQHPTIKDTYEGELPLTGSIQKKTRRPMLPLDLAIAKGTLWPSVNNN